MFVAEGKALVQFNVTVGAAADKLDAVQVTFEIGLFAWCVTVTVAGADCPPPLIAVTR